MFLWFSVSFIRMFISVADVYLGSQTVELPTKKNNHEVASTFIHAVHGINLRCVVFTIGSNYRSTASLEVVDFSFPTSSCCP